MAPRRRLIAVVAIAAVALAIGAASLTAWRAGRTLRLASTEINLEENFAVGVGSLSLSGDSRFDWLPAPAVFTGGAIFEGHLYLCGPSGLFEYGNDGQLEKIFRVGRELPAFPLTALATGTLSDARGPELLIATHGAGVLAWDGRRMRQIAALAPGKTDGPNKELSTDANTITALLPLTSGRLLMGTAKLGVLVYDGQHLRYFHSTLKKLSITALAGNEAELWVGTLNHGVFHWRGGESEQIAEAQGLPDPHVNAIAIADGATYVATPVGIAEVARGRVQRVLAEGVFAQAVAVKDNALAVGSFDQGIMMVPLTGERRGIRPLFSPDSAAANEGSIVQMFTSGGTLYAVARDGLYARSEGQRWQKVISASPAMLTDRNVSALAVDDEGRLWVGYFDRGLDIVSASLDHALHREDDHVFCINRIVPDDNRHTVNVATANGLVVFDGEGKERGVMGKAAGLIAEDATDVALYRGGMAIATPAGLTFMDATGVHSLYAFQGLVNNHVYALAMRGNRLMAGTLGGLSILDSGNVRLNLTTATSTLKHNWITAVVPVSDGWLVGTYGAGVEHLNMDNHFDETEATRSGVEVNPNAMLATANHVMVGTLGSGLMVLNRSTQRWRTITAGLPSLNVTAFATSGGTIYIGTDNGLVKIQEGRLDE